MIRKRFIIAAVIMVTVMTAAFMIWKTYAHTQENSYKNAKWVMNSGKI